MERLPPEIVVNILSWLPVTSLLQSKLVCRAWRRLIQDPLLVTNHSSRMADGDPSFILQTNWPVPNQIYFVDLFADHEEGEVMLKTLPISAMHMYYLVESCNGLICLYDSLERISLYNPLNRFHIELPKLTKFAPRFGLFGFGFLPTTKEYKLVHIMYQRNFRTRASNQIATSFVVQSEVHVLTIGSPGWRNLGMVPYRFLWQPSQVLVQGRLHWLCKPNRYTTAIQFVSFDLATEQFEQIPEPDCCGSDRCFQHLVVLRGYLSAAAYHEDDKLEIWIMKEYGVKETWMKEFTIGSYLPTTLPPDELVLFQNSRIHFPDRFVRVVCILKNGEILLEYIGRELVLYDPRHGTFKEVVFPEMQNCFKLVPHVGSLNGI